MTKRPSIYGLPAYLYTAVKQDIKYFISILIPSIGILIAIVAPITIVIAFLTKS